MKFSDIIYFMHKIELHKADDMHKHTRGIELSLYDIQDLSKILSVVYVADSKIRKFKRSASICMENEQFDVAIQDLKYATALSKILRKAKQVIRENF